MTRRFVILISSAFVFATAFADASMFLTPEPETEGRSLLFRRLCGHRGGPTKLTGGKFTAFEIEKDQWRTFVLEGVPSGATCACETTCAFTPLNIDLFSNTDNDVTLDTTFAFDDASENADSEESTTVSLNNGSNYDCYAYVYAHELADGCFIECKRLTIN